MRFNRENLKYPRFLSFPLCPTPEIKNSEISESNRMLQILIVSIALSVRKL